MFGAADGRRKDLLKRAVADLIPAQALARPKKGFGTALDQWCRTWAGDLLEKRLASCDIFRSEIISASQIKNLLAEHRQGNRSHHAKLWNILCLTEWWERYGMSAASSNEEELVCQS